MTLGASRSPSSASPAITYRFGELAILDLGRDVDVVLMRQDPPFDLGYITATHLLERIQGETLVVNDPAGVRNAPEKVWVLDFAQFMPPTADHPLARRSRANSSPSMARSSSSRCTALPADRCSGSAATARNLASLMELFNRTYREPHVLQKFLPEIAEGDKRIVLVDGEVAGAINRVPARARSARTSPSAARPRRPS